MDTFAPQTYKVKQPQYKPWRRLLLCKLNFIVKKQGFKTPYYGAAGWTSFPRFNGLAVCF
jgi:hypothetical protein